MKAPSGRGPYAAWWAVPSGAQASEHADTDWRLRLLLRGKKYWKADREPGDWLQVLQIGDKLILASGSNPTPSCNSQPGHKCK